MITGLNLGTTKTFMSCATDECRVIGSKDEDAFHYFIDSDFKVIISMQNDLMVITFKIEYFIVTKTD